MGGEASDRVVLRMTSLFPRLHGSYVCSMQVKAERFAFLRLMTSCASREFLLFLGALKPPNEIAKEMAAYTKMSTTCFPRVLSNMHYQRRKKHEASSREQQSHMDGFSGKFWEKLTAPREVPNLANPCGRPFGKKTQA